MRYKLKKQSSFKRRGYNTVPAISLSDSLTVDIHTREMNCYIVSELKVYLKENIVFFMDILTEIVKAEDTELQMLSKLLNFLLCSISFSFLIFLKEKCNWMGAYKVWLIEQMVSSRIGLDSNGTLVQ